jgi:hypothetical protein
MQESEAQRLQRLGMLQPERPTLSVLISGALRGDAKSLFALETTSPDAAMLQEAVALLQVRPSHRDKSARGPLNLRCWWGGGLQERASRPAEGQFAATVLVRHARTGEVADLGAMCNECLQIALAAPSAPGTRQLLAASAAAATRAAPEATVQVLGEAMRLAEQGERASALLALQLVNALGEESARPSVGSGVREALKARCVEVLGLVCQG